MSTPGWREGSGGPCEFFRWCVLSVRVLMECVCVGGESCDCVIASVGALIVEGYRYRELSSRGTRAEATDIRSLTALGYLDS